jgi:hypothetical protein
MPQDVCVPGILLFCVGVVASLAASWLLVSRLERLGERAGFSEAWLGLVAALAADAPEITSSAVALARGQAGPGGERGQQERPGRRRHRVGLLELGQGLGLGGGGELGGGGQVAQPGADHFQRLTGCCRDVCTHLVASLPGLVAAGGGSRPWRAGF